MRESISTAITELFGIERPILLAGMNVAAGPELAAEVTNNGGLGVIGGVGYTPKLMRDQLDELKSHLKDGMHHSVLICYYHKLVVAREKQTKITQVALYRNSLI